MFLPHFDVLCDLLLDRCTATWNLFVLYNKELNFVRIKAALFHVRRAKVGPSPFWQTRKKPFGVIYDLYKIKQSHWLLCAAKDCDWPRKITPLSNLSRASLLAEWKLTVKPELNCEIYKSRKCWILQVSFCDQSSPVNWKTWLLPERCRSCKNTLGKLAIVVNLEAIRFEFWTERRVSDGENLCPLWSVILISVWNSVGDTFELLYSWPWAEVSCTLLAAVPWNLLEHSHRKARLCVFI